nr:MAG: chaperone of endosialidase [Bacteriophage sp.]
MALYRQGKAAMDANGVITGTGTKWQSALSLIRPGSTIMFLSSPIQMAVINKVVSDTQINAITTNGAVVPSSDYAILLSDSLTVDGLAQDVAETLRYYQSQETVIAEALEFFKDFDLNALQELADQVRADAEESATNAAAAAASKDAAKTSETNSKASEQAALTARQQAGSARDQTQDLYNQTVDLVSGVQAPDKLPTSPGSSRAWMKIANVKNAGQSNCFAQFIIGGGANFGSQNLPVDIFSISGRDLPDTLTSNNIDANFTQCALIPASNSTSRLKLGVVKNTDGSFDVYLLSPNGYFPVMWLNRLNVQANNGLITGPIIDRTGYTWITTEPAGIVYNSPADYLASNDNTVARTNVANTFSQPQAISVPGGNATLTLNGAVVRANNSNAIVYSIPKSGQGMYFRPNGDMNSAKQVVFDAANFTVTGLNATFSNAVTMLSTLRVNGASNLRGGVDVTSTQKLPLKETTTTNGIGVQFIGDNATECSFGIENTSGGSAVFHNYTRGANNAASSNGQLIGGYGSRPWDGSAYTEHSNVSQHFLQDGTCSATNHGGWFRLLTTPLNATMDNRRQTFATSNNGDLWIGYDVPMGTYKMEGISSGASEPLSWNGRGLKQINNSSNELNLITPRNGGSSSTVIRANSCNGSLSSRGSSQLGDAFYVGFGGHDGNDWVGLKASIRFAPSEGFSATAAGAGITFSTTAIGTTNRVDRWNISNAGVMYPGADNAYSIGNSSLRVSAVYAAKGAIQTSDARLKSEVRKFTDNEIAAAKLLSQEIGIYSWLAKQAEEGEDAREHIGLTVQRAIEIMESCGLDPMHYGFICYDEWEEEEIVIGYDDDVNPIMGKKEAGDRYSFRYDQLNLFIARGIEARLSAIEEKLGM